MNQREIVEQRAHSQRERGFRRQLGHASPAACTPV
jgi:hypothetical protein